VTPSCDLTDHDRLVVLRAVARTPCLANGVRKGEQVVVTGARLDELGHQPDDLPAARGSQPFGVQGAQVVGVRLRVGRQRAEHRGRVRVHVGQRRHRGARTGRPRALSG
jgi:hypothetical protein